MGSMLFNTGFSNILKECVSLDKGNKIKQNKKYTNRTTSNWKAFAQQSTSPAKQKDNLLNERKYLPNDIFDKELIYKIY